MTLECKIKDIFTKIKKEPKLKTIHNDIDTIEQYIKNFFYSRLSCEYESSSISKDDIIQSICKFISNNSIFKPASLMLFNGVLKNISNYKLDIIYIQKNYEQLLTIGNCISRVDSIVVEF